jgi:hypothetical protein
VGTDVSGEIVKLSCPSSRVKLSKKNWLSTSLGTNLNLKMGFEAFAASVVQIVEMPSILFCFVRE